MINIQRVLCPTDLTSESDEALRYAVALASAYGAKLFLLYCKENQSTADGNVRTPADHDAESLFTSSLAPHLGLNSFRDFDWQGLVVEDVENIGKAIVDAAGKRQIDLIVMRSRRRPRAAVLLGSTAETVCRSAPCPELVTHPLEQEWVGLSTGHARTIQNRLVRRVCNDRGAYHYCDAHLEALLQEYAQPATVNSNDPCARRYLGSAL